MKPQIKTIEIGLENCELLEVPITSVRFFNVSHSFKNYFLHYHRSDNELHEVEFMTGGKLVLNNIKDIKNITGWFDNEKNAYERLLEYNDITQIYLKYDNGTTKTFHLHWFGDSENYNLGQKTYLKDDEIHITFFKPKQIK